MELKQLLSVFSKHIQNILLFTAIFAGMGVAFYFFVPPKYQAKGSFYVTRGVDVSRRTDFTYEGYYAQQAGINYAGTLIGLFESVDVRKVALDSLGMPISESSLRELARNMDTKKIAPQLVVLTVKENSLKEAESFWLALSDAVITSSERLNEDAGDPLLTVSPVGRGPVVHQTYSNVLVDTFLGAVFGLFLGSFIAVLKEYIS